VIAAELQLSKSKPNRAYNFVIS